MKILTLDQIKAILPTLDLLPAIEADFAAYSADRAVVPGTTTDTDHGFDGISGRKWPLDVGKVAYLFS